MTELDFDRFGLKISKHFRNTWMMKWNWDVQDLRNSLKEAYKIDRVGNYKYEAYTKYKSKGRSKKLIFVIYQVDNTLYIITGAEGA